MNTTPISLAQNLCSHSQKKMNLKSASVKLVLSSWYCGVCWYLWNSVSQAFSLSGGIVPVMTFHSVMDSPEPVRRVTPPSTTWMMSMMIPIPIQMATGRYELFIMDAKVRRGGGRRQWAMGNGQWANVRREIFFLLFNLLYPLRFRLHFQPNNPVPS